MDTVSFTVIEEDAGLRIDVLLSQRAGMSRAAAQRIIEGGRVETNGSVVAKNHRVRPGERISYRPPEPEPSEPPATAIPVDVRYEDEYMLVLSKPAGLVVHPAAGHRADTLVNALLHRYPELATGEVGIRPGIVHRLDKLTSGLMLVARTAAGRDRLTEMIAGRQVQREYLALVHGTFLSREGVVDAPIGRDPRNRQRMAVTDSRSRSAVTHFRVLDSWAEASLLEVKLETGRTHQIRVHLAFIGHPVVGDSVYGRIGALEEITGLHRQFLHAFRLSLPHPFSGEPLEFLDPLPEDLERALARLRAAHSE